jgi:DNA-binding CsgD family transcriptional regulator
MDLLTRDPGAFLGVVHYAGEGNTAGGFDLHLFGAGLTVKKHLERVFAKLGVETRSAAV